MLNLIFLSLMIGMFLFSTLDYNYWLLCTLCIFKQVKPFFLFMSCQHYLFDNIPYSKSILNDCVVENRCIFHYRIKHDSWFIFSFFLLFFLLSSFFLVVQVKDIFCSMNIQMFKDIAYCRLMEKFPFICCPSDLCLPVRDMRNSTFLS